MSIGAIVFVVLAVAVAYYGSSRPVLRDAVPCTAVETLAPVPALGAAYPAETCAHPYGLDLYQIVEDADLAHIVVENNVTSARVRRFSDYFQSFADNAVSADAQYLVVSLSSTWCTFCLDLSKAMVELAAQYGGVGQRRGFVFGAILTPTMQAGYDTAPLHVLEMYAAETGMGVASHTFCGWDVESRFEKFLPNMGVPMVIFVHLPSMQVHTVMSGYDETRFRELIEIASRHDGGARLLAEYE